MSTADSICAESEQDRDFVEFYRHIVAADKESPLIFNCQLGGGRTTTGVVIACLIRQHLFKRYPDRHPPFTDTAGKSLLVKFVGVCRRLPSVSIGARVSK